MQGRGQIYLHVLGITKNKEYLKYFDEAQSLEENGRLYNGYAVDDARGLCPSGWHVPTDEEWMALEMELGMSESEANSTGWRGTDEGTQLRSTYGWYEGGNGADNFGFSALLEPKHRNLLCVRPVALWEPFREPSVP